MTRLVRKRPMSADPLSDVLKALELTGEVRFAIEGKKIIVMP